MAMPPDVRNWIEGASLVRMRRDIELATVEANSLSMDKRGDWLASKRHELEFQHQERMIDAERRWPVAMTEARDAFLAKTIGVVDGRYK